MNDVQKKTARGLLQWGMAVIIIGGVTWTFNLSYATHEKQAQHNADANPHAAVLELTQAKIDGKLTMIEEDIGDLTEATKAAGKELRLIHDEQIEHRGLLKQIKESINDNGRR